MNILAFILFGLINGLIFHIIDENSSSGSYFHAMLLGMLGALTGGTFAYFLFGGVTQGITPTLSIIILMETMLLGLLFFGKFIKQVGRI